MRDADLLEEAWKAYLDVEKDCATRLAYTMREWVEQATAPDGRKLFPEAFAVEAESSRHRGPHRSLISRGRSSVRVHGGEDDQRVDLRAYIWSTVCYQDQQSGKNVPVCDILYSNMPHLDSGSGNRHAAANQICIAPPMVDGYSDPENLIKPIGALRSKMDQATVEKLKAEVASEITGFCAKNHIDIHTGAKLEPAAALACGGEAGSDE